MKSVCGFPVAEKLESNGDQPVRMRVKSENRVGTLIDSYTNGSNRVRVLLRIRNSEDWYDLEDLERV